MRTVGGQLKLLAPEDLDTQPISLAAQQKRVTGKLVGDPVMSSAMTDGVVAAAAVGPVADPFEPIWTALNSILSPIYAAGFVLLFAVLIPVSLLRYQFLSFLDSVGLGALAEFLAGIGAPPAFPAAYAATAEVDATLAPMLKSAPLVSDPVPVAAIAESIPATEDNGADLSKQVASLEPNDTALNAEAGDASIEVASDTAEENDESMLVAEAAEVEEDSTIVVSEAAEAEEDSTADVDSTGDRTEVAETGKESPEVPAAAGSEPKDGSAVASSPASAADGESSDGDSADGSADGP
jgi:hypothetical protein